MGNTLDKPKTDKDTSVGGNVEDGLSWGVSSMQGWRLAMEDAHIIATNGSSEETLDRVVKHSSSRDDRESAATANQSGDTKETNVNTNQNDGEPSVTNSDKETGDNDSKDNEDLRLPPHHYFFCVLDGHGGDFAAKYGRDNLLPILLEQDAFQEYERLWKATTTQSTTRSTGSSECKSQATCGGKKRKQAWQSKNHKQGKNDATRHPGNQENKWNTNHAKKTSQKAAGRRRRQGEDCKYILERQPELLQRAMEDAFVELDLMLLQEMVHRKMVLLSPLAFLNNHAVVESMDDDWGTFDRMEEDTITTTNMTKSQNFKGDTISGTTTVAVLVTPEWILCANLGDSRASLLLSSSERQHQQQHPPAQTSPDNHTNKNKNNNKNNKNNNQRGNKKKKRNDSATRMNQSEETMDGGNSCQSGDDYWTIVALSEDHKPDLPEEQARIEAANGSVTMGGRVDGELAVSRALGDFGFKDAYPRYLYSGASCSMKKRRSLRRRRQRGDLQGNEESNGVNQKNLDKKEEGLNWEHQRTLAQQLKVSPFPEVFAYPRGTPSQEKNGNDGGPQPGNEKVLLLGCDGIWDVMTNESCHNLVQELMAEGETNMGLIAEEIMDTCLKKGSRDNMTMMVIHFADSSSPKGTIDGSGHSTPSSGGGVLKRRKQRNSAGRGGKAA